MSDIKQDFQSLRDHISISGPYVPPSVILTERQVAELERGMIELQQRAEKAEALLERIRQVAIHNNQGNAIVPSSMILEKGEALGRAKKVEARVAKLEAALDRLDGLLEFLAIDRHDDSRLEVHKFMAESLLRNLQDTIWEVKK